MILVLKPYEICLPVMPLPSGAEDICEGWRRREYEVAVDVHLSLEDN